MRGMLRLVRLREVQENLDVAGEFTRVQYCQPRLHPVRLAGRIISPLCFAVERQAACRRVLRGGVSDPLREFSGRLIDWQIRHGRHGLPWQGTRDAYRVWLSEIMLQQTQVSSVIPYYQRFLARFPSLETLAGAPLEAVLEAWAGLGYYARARNLHRCAQIVVSEHAGQFPRDAERAALLPGIGRSTAAAICAFAFGSRCAILDGNVKRVLARCFGIEGFPGSAAVEREMWALAESLLPEEGIESYTQGLMDLGSSLCTRHKPFCGGCPMHDLCVARRSGRQAELPVARPRKTLPERESSVLVLVDGERVLLERRPPSGIWGGLLALPECLPDKVEAFALHHACLVRSRVELPPVKHTFTHFHLHIRPVLCRIERQADQLMEPAAFGWEWLPLSSLADAALPTPIRRLLQRL